jgi:hypothetical protein
MPKAESSPSRAPLLPIACRICGNEMRLAVKPSIEGTVYAYQCVNGHRRELVTNGRAISQLYLNLASACFNKAAIAEQADGGEALRRMGSRYIAEASALVDA